MKNEILPLREAIDYDPITGDMTWKHRADVPEWVNKRLAGKPAGSTNGNGYLEVTVLGVKRKAHRVAWALHHGEWPAGQIDHINGARDDNRMENLRVVTNAENQRNTKLPITNSSGVIGVYWHGRGEKWRAQIDVDGRKKHLGLFSDFDAAVAARKAAEAEFGYHHGHGRTAREVCR